MMLDMMFLPEQNHDKGVNGQNGMGMVENLLRRFRH
jgi:hypothetical protein